jgi:CubicO group peptidase (beta-lactamase class C family)
MGYFLGGAEADGGAIAIGPSGKEFGHSGNGGSLGFADPERNFSFGLTKNLMRAMPDAAQSTPYLLAELIRKQLPRSS